MLTLITKAGRTTNAFAALRRAAWHDAIKPDFKSGDFQTFRALVDAKLLETRQSGPRGGTQYHITESGKAAFEAVQEEIRKLLVKA